MRMQHDLRTAGDEGVVRGPGANIGLLGEIPRQLTRCRTPGEHSSRLSFFVAMVWPHGLHADARAQERRRRPQPSRYLDPECPRATFTFTARRHVVVSNRSLSHTIRRRGVCGICVWGGIWSLADHPTRPFQTNSNEAQKPALAHKTPRHPSWKKKKKSKHAKWGCPKDEKTPAPESRIPHERRKGNNLAKPRGRKPPF
jgi:hypothetical protein